MGGGGGGEGDKQQQQLSVLSKAHRGISRTGAFCAGDFPTFLRSEVSRLTGRSASSCAGALNDVVFMLGPSPYTFSRATSKPRSGCWKSKSKKETVNLVTLL